MILAKKPTCDKTRSQPKGREALKHDFSQKAREAIKHDLRQKAEMR